VAHAGCCARISTLILLRSVFNLRYLQLKLLSCKTGLSSMLNSIDSSAIASNIKHHAEFAPLFSPEHCSPLKAYHATAKSVLDALLINWNATYDYYNKTDIKQAYYLSMEFLQVPQSRSINLIIYILLNIS
jgi:glycogen phosphorylase